MSAEVKSLKKKMEESEKASRIFKTRCEQEKEEKKKPDYVTVLKLQFQSSGAFPELLLLGCSYLKLVIYVLGRSKSTTTTNSIFSKMGPIKVSLCSCVTFCNFTQ